MNSFGVCQVSELSTKESTLAKQAKALERKVSEHEQQLRESREKERENDKAQGV